MTPEEHAVFVRLYVLAKDAGEILLDYSPEEQPAAWEEWKEDAKRVLPVARAALKQTDREDRA